MVTSQSLASQNHMCFEVNREDFNVLKLFSINLVCKEIGYSQKADLIVQIFYDGTQVELSESTESFISNSGNTYFGVDSNNSDNDPTTDAYLYLDVIFLSDQYVKNFQSSDNLVELVFELKTEFSGAFIHVEALSKSSGSSIFERSIYISSD